MPLDREMEAFITAIIVALARTWDAKLPGFRSEFETQIDSLYVQIPVGEHALRDSVDRLSQALKAS